MDIVDRVDIVDIVYRVDIADIVDRGRYAAPGHRCHHGVHKAGVQQQQAEVETCAVNMEYI